MALDALELGQHTALCALPRGEVHLAIGQRLEHVHRSLKRIGIARIEQDVSTWLKRARLGTADENGLRRVVGVCHVVQRPGPEERPGATLQQLDPRSIA